MKITFHGAAGTTTGSRHLLEINGRRILLDCGLFQGRRAESYEKNRHFPFPAGSIDAVILSHAHIDHSGNLPNLCKQGFRGNVFATFATRDLCQLMLADSAHVQAADVRFVNKKRAKLGQPPVEPIYSTHDAELCLRQFVSIGYDRPVPVADGVTLTFLDAGHILGSAQILLDLHDHSSGRKMRLLFSGDVVRGNNDLLRNPAASSGVDAVIMESTYGGREHEAPTRAHDKLCEILNRALATGGKVLIPSFAVERTQQLIYSLNRITESGCLPPVEVFVDSPLAVNATEVFRLHPECFNEEVYNFLHEKRNPFGFEGLTMVREVSQSMTLNTRSGPGIIIAASGMCEAGRILHHLRNHIDDPATTILFVGYCAPDTLGWKIRQGHKEVNIFGEPFPVHARIELLDSFSGHADHSELLDYYRAIGGPKHHTWLVHGEPERSQALLPDLQKLHPKGTFAAAQPGQSVTL